MQCGIPQANTPGGQTAWVSSLHRPFGGTRIQDISPVRNSGRCLFKIVRMGLAQCF